MPDSRLPILIAVPYPPMGGYLADVARGLGFEPSLTYGWNEALSAARRRDFSIILVDERLIPSSFAAPGEAFKAAGIGAVPVLLRTRMMSFGGGLSPELVLREPERPAAIREVLNRALESVAIAAA